jgi:molybdenum cofactor cytidylyltransferase
MAKIAAIILAAGSSTRMRGKQKMLLPWKDSTIIETTLQRIKAASPYEVWLITSQITHEELEGATENVCLNPDAVQGMTTSIKSGVKEASDEADAFMICLGDMPLIQTETYAKLMKAFADTEDPDAIIQPLFQGRPGQPVIFSRAYRESILSHKEPEGCREIVKGNKSHVIRIEVNDPGVIQDIDDPETYMLLA